MSTAEQVLTGPMIQSGTGKKEKMEKQFPCVAVITAITDISGDLYRISDYTESDFQFLQR